MHRLRRERDTPVCYWPQSLPVRRYAKGATASAMYYTLIESAKANIVAPFKYLLHLCKHIAKAESVDYIEALLPWNVKDQQKR